MQSFITIRMIQTTPFEQEVNNYKTKQNATVKLIKILSDLWFNDAIELVLFRNQLVDRRVSVVLNLHQNSESLTQRAVTVFETLEVAQVIQQLELLPSRIDIGTLALEIRQEQINSNAIYNFVERKLSLANQHQSFEPRDVVLYGFGRIGRLLARELVNKVGAGMQLRLRAIVTRDEINQKNLAKRASLLRNDSIHGDFEGLVDIDLEKAALVLNGITIPIISAKNPEDIDYTQYGIKNALIIDNTGAFRDKEELSRHLKAKGATQVLLTAPGKGVPNIVYGVNQSEIDNDKSTSIYSAASCTTNAISPVLAVIQENLKIKKGHIETIHAYTNDQNLVDNMHKKSRRGRAAGLNMVITETGAGTAVAKVLPLLQGKLTSNAIRVPVPNGSLAILQLEVEKETNTEQLNDILKKATLNGALVEQIKFSTDIELVSSDIIGTSAAAIIDAPATIVASDATNIILYVWYDNEYGYTHQVMRLARHIAGVRRFTYY